MRLSKSYRNIVSNCTVQIVSSLVGIIIPRFIILQYGSTINGMIGSIGQFLTYVSLVEAGIGNASIVALYRPLIKNEWTDISNILSEAAHGYKKTGIIYIVLSIVLACVYPLTVKQQIEYSYAFSMTIILALVGVIDYLAIGKYKVLLTADNKYYIINFAKVIANSILIIGSIIFLEKGFSLLIVKALAVVTHAGEALFIKYYVSSNYNNISFKRNVKVKLEQQTSAIIHQICMVITYNTDLIVMTLLLPSNSLLEISVYSVYSLVLSFVKNMMNVLCTGMSAPFGRLYAEGEQEKMFNLFKRYELVYDIVLFVVYTCCLTLIFPFVRCYVRDTSDANYLRVEIAILFTLIGLFAQLKDAHGTLVNGGCGKYKETRKYAIYEAIMNLGLSILLIDKLGLIGVLIGTLISHIFMDYGTIRYACKFLLPQIRVFSYSRIIRNSCVFIVLGYIEFKYCMYIDNWKEWFSSAIIIVIINIGIFVIWNYIFEPKLMYNMLFAKDLGKENVDK